MSPSAWFYHWRGLRRMLVLVLAVPAWWLILSSVGVSGETAVGWGGLLAFPTMVLLHYLARVFNYLKYRAGRARALSRIATLGLREGGACPAGIHLETVFEKQPLGHRGDAAADAASSESAAIVRHVGVLSHFFWTGHNDVLTFGLVAPEGESSWVVEGDPIRYAVGKVVRVTAVPRTLRLPPDQEEIVFEAPLRIETEV